MTPTRPTWSSTPHSPAEGLAAVSATTPLLPGRRTSGPPSGQDLLLSRTVIGRREVALRGPFRLRLASACRTAARVGTDGPAQPRTRAGAMSGTLAPAGDQGQPGPTTGVGGAPPRRPPTTAPAARSARAALGQRRAGRDDVVDEQHRPAGDPDAEPAAAPWTAPARFAARSGPAEAGLVAGCAGTAAARRDPGVRPPAPRAAGRPRPGSAAASGRRPAPGRRPAGTAAGHQPHGSRQPASRRRSRDRPGEGVGQRSAQAGSPRSLCASNAAARRRRRTQRPPRSAAAPAGTGPAGRPGGPARRGRTPRTTRRPRCRSRRSSTGSTRSSDRAQGRPAATGRQGGVPARSVRSHGPGAAARSVDGRPPPGVPPMPGSARVGRVGAGAERAASRRPEVNSHQLAVRRADHQRVLLRPHRRRRP